ncbi:zinc-ribbon and FHA domain-containing protein [Streptomyces sp. LX-29]|uniref:FHA domain-containing protein n=1 Tax=Streptomyces sp. LX-29 TaxID=2900152 RepID=UPI00240E843A|nr:FHA domain-containing protein [Streptomyces sp. LX-29]WFB11451.1 zinc-ribbon and FHA domain-containing protein [Streptomyces sp. LX-29]
MGGAWWKLSDGHGRCTGVRVGRCVHRGLHRGFVLPYGRVCFGQGESPVKLFGKLFGKSARQDGASGTARHRAAGSAEGGAHEEQRPLFRDQIGGQAGGAAGAAPIGSGGPAAPGAGYGVAVCTRCGNRNAETSRFCSNCGAPLRGGVTPERASETTSTISISGLEAYDSEVTGQTPLPALSPEAQAAVEALPSGSALLVVRRGPNSGSRFLLDGDLTTAGRHPQSDIFLDDVTVSRRHVEFRRGADGLFTVADVGSLNGTYVNREAIDAVQLHNGDEVQIGKYRLVFFASQRGVGI